MLKRLTLSILMIFSFHAYGDVSIVSNPEDAEIFVVDTGSGEKFNIGSTPFEGKLEDLLGRTGDGNSVFIHVEKPGFETYRLLLASFGGSSLDLNLNLEVSKDMKLIEDFDLLAGELFDVQRMTRGRDFNSALQKIDSLEEKFPHFSIIQEMRGSVFYLQQEYTRSLSAFRRAFALNAKNRDAYRMMVYLERRFELDDSRQVAEGN